MAFGRGCAACESAAEAVGERSRKRFASFAGAQNEVSGAGVNVRIGGQALEQEMLKLRIHLVDALGKPACLVESFMQLCWTRARRMGCALVALED